MSAMVSPIPRSGTVVDKYLIPDLPSSEEVLPYLRRIDQARWYSNFGPLVCEFEEGLRALLSASDPGCHSRPISLTTLVSGHHALEIALALSGIGPGKTVLLPAVTFPSCPLAVQRLGAIPVLGDIDQSTWRLTPAIARAAASHSQIHAVMPVAVYGVPVPTWEWDDFSRDTGIPVVIDAAAAIETQKIPQYGLVAHSLHATKPFGVGEGGVLVGCSPDMIARARRYSNFGMLDRQTHMTGSNAKMSEYHGAVALAQLQRWPEVKKRRSNLLKTYVECLQPLMDYIALQPSIDSAVVCNLMLFLKEPLAEAVLEKSKGLGLALHRTYLPPLYHHPYFRALPVVNTDGAILAGHPNAWGQYSHMPNSEMLLAHLVGVPFHPFMTEIEVAFVGEALSSLLVR
jgi:dTDP-4-amino-4,6-dideoxygalactose transaminase